MDLVEMWSWDRRVCPGRVEVGKRGLSWERVGCSGERRWSWERVGCPGRERVVLERQIGPGRERFDLGERVVLGVGVQRGL